MSLGVFIAVVVLLLAAIIIKPKIWKISTYIIPPIIGVIVLIIAQEISFEQIYQSLFNNPLISPLKILVLFLAMTLISTICDCLGIFKFIALKTVKWCKNSQFSLFTVLYFLISILTIFTSNDIIILTFTPFIIYLCHKINVSPIPYLVGEFIAANTASMMLVVGNPTNILIATSFGITFLDYLSHMWYVALAAIVLLYGLLILVFYRKIKDPIVLDLEEEEVKLSRLPSIVAIAHLIVTTILLAISNYINLEMYLITAVMAGSLLIFMLIYVLISKNEKSVFKDSFSRLPYSVIPFLICMFIIVECLNLHGYIEQIADVLNKIEPVYSYGVTSFLACNFMNNIPMSLLYSNILTYSSGGNEVYAAIIGSNLGAYLTPLGALAGIMWLTILKGFDVKFSFLDFMKYGAMFAIPTLLLSITLLFLI